MTAPPVSFADFFDGDSGLVHRAGVTLHAEALEIALPDAPSLRWPLGDLRGIPDQASDRTLALTSVGTPLARLYLADPATRAALLDRAPGLRLRPPVRGKSRIVAWALAAVASVALIVFVLVPTMADQLAGFLPPEGERALGDATFEQIRQALDETGLGSLPLCETPAGRQAFGTLQARLSDGLDLPYPLTVSVLDHGMINAFALPGGHIVLFRGLIDAAEHPDEVAAVFAHELGHVVARDPARIALRSAGSIGVLGLLFGDFAGGAVVLFLVDRLIQADYSREAEAAADDFAAERLRAAGLPPEALARMFRRLRDRHGDAEGIVAHFLSHPSLGDRIARAAAAGAGRDGARPALDPAAWQALRTICD